MTYAEALAWTYGLEAPVVLAAGWLWGCSLVRSGLAALAASAVTHPIAWSIAVAMPADVYESWGWHAIEAVVCGVEAVVLGRIMLLSACRAWPLSIAANGLSAVVGRYVF